MSKRTRLENAWQCNCGACCGGALENCPLCDVGPEYRRYPEPEIFCDKCGLSLKGNTLHSLAKLWNRRPGEDRAFANGELEGMADGAACA